MFYVFVLCPQELAFVFLLIACCFQFAASSRKIAHFIVLFIDEQNVQDATQRKPNSYSSALLAKIVFFTHH
jgi:hypothetical protein